MRKEKNNEEAKFLHQKAEELLEKKAVKKARDFFEVESLKFIHELEVHQIELELQNEELLLAQEASREVSEKYMEFYDFSPLGYFTLSRDSKIVELNFAGAKMLGKERSFLKNMLFSVFVSPETKTIFKLFLESVFSSNEKKTCEVMLSINGHLFRNVHLTSIITKNKEQCYLNVMDITAHKQTKEALIKALESDRLKSDFLANMSHEIRTPMNSILGFVALLKDSLLSDQEKQAYISIVEKSGNHMLHLVNDLINIAKIESAQMEVEISKINVNDIIKAIHNLFAAEVKEKGINLSIHNSLPKEEAFIQSDEEKLYGILTNLVKNAIKFTNKGFIEFGYEKKGAYFEFFVRDTGMGIDDVQKKIIFERFKKVKEKLVQNNEGAGLGLSIAKAYVEILGGKIWVESQLEKGSTFYFTIPYNAESKKMKLVTNVDASVLKDDDINNLKILITEDDADSLVLLEKTVKKISKVILQARTGSEAVKICRNNHDIDLILMDIRLPEMDGYEVTKAIRKFRKDIVIIAQTACALDGDREKAIAAGCNDYISKPICLNELRGIIKKFFN